MGPRDSQRLHARKMSGYMVTMGTSSFQLTAVGAISKLNSEAPQHQARRQSSLLHNRCHTTGRKWRPNKSSTTTSCRLKAWRTGCQKSL